MSSWQATKPLVGEGQDGLLPPRTPRGERVQHAVFPDDAVRPFPEGYGRSGGASPERHCRQLWVRSFGHPAFIFLRPFAPPALPGFSATMDALTPGHGPFLEVASATSYLPWRPMLRRGLDGWGVVRPRPLHASRRDSLSRPGIPVSFATPSVHSASNHPLPSRCVHLGFSAIGLTVERITQDTSNPFGNVRLGLRLLGCRLATTTGRIEFAVADHSQPLLRTGRSPPVALHPASRRRSYLRLRETRPPSARTFTSRMQQHYRRTPLPACPAGEQVQWLSTWSTSSPAGQAGRGRMT
jgi:hypothetical protein